MENRDCKSFAHDFMCVRLLLDFFQFLENGGKHGKNLLYFGSSSQLSTPNLDELLLDWGIKMDYGTVFETDENYALSSDGLNTAMMIELSENEYQFWLRDELSKLNIKYDPVFEDDLDDPEII